MTRRRAPSLPQPCATCTSHTLQQRPARGIRGGGRGLKGPKGMKSGGPSTWPRHLPGVEGRRKRQREGDSQEPAWPPCAPAQCRVPSGPLCSSASPRSPSPPPALSALSPQGPSTGPGGLSLMGPGRRLRGTGEAWGPVRQDSGALDHAECGRERPGKPCGSTPLALGHTEHHHSVSSRK